MSSTAPNPDSLSPNAGHFTTTLWPMVLAAARSDSTQAQEALARLCQIYWYPLYAYVRRQGYAPHDAQDLTQDYFTRLLEKRFLADVAREKGKFRSFLLASLKHFLANEWNRAHTQKRGGRRALVSLDDTEAESRYRLEAADTLTADKIFERRWAMTLLELVLERLRREYAEHGKAELYEHLKGCLTGPGDCAAYAELAGKLTMSEGAIKVAAHRLRHRYRELLREEIAQTVSSPDELEEEMHSLFAALGG